MKIIVMLYNGRVEQVERYKNNETTKQEYGKLIEMKKSGELKDYEFTLTNLAIFDD